MRGLVFLFLFCLIPISGLAVNEKPVCGSQFLADFTKHYGIIECLSRGDKLCISKRVNEKSTTAFASMAGATGAAAAKISTSKVLSGFVKQGATTVGSKVAWGAIAGGAYFVGTKVVGGVVGFFVDTSPAGDCRDMHPWVLRVPGKKGCEVAYKITDNHVAENFFSLDNEAMQLDILRDSMACNYFYNLHLFLKAQGETIAAQQGIDDPGLFSDSPNSEVLPKTSRNPQYKEANPSSKSGVQEGTR